MNKSNGSILMLFQGECKMGFPFVDLEFVVGISVQF
jgi:hypothetical protein